MTVRVAAATALSLLAGCASLPPPAAEDDWPARRESLQAIEAWRLDGRIAVAAGGDGFSGGLRWEQGRDHADIGVSGPMGGKGLSVRVDGGQPTVFVDGERISQEESDRLLAGYFGAGRTLPLAEMRFWMVGVPAPGLPAAETLGDDRRLARLAQSGWQVRYDRYQSFGTLTLPARVEMTAGDLRLRIVTADWRRLP